jgi:hypothetical protein
MMLPIVEAEMAVGARESMMPDKVTTRKKPSGNLMLTLISVPILYSMFPGASGAAIS